MAIVLYKPGNTHTVRGVECEAGRFEVNELENALSLGWKKDPKEVAGEVEQNNTPDETETETESNGDVVSLDEADRETLKDYAKQIGVKHAANIGTDKLREKIREALDA
jgi:hypothetical protein